MPDEQFWRQRYEELGIHSIGPGDTRDEEELVAHKKIFQDQIQPWLDQLQGPVLDFGCGIGRWAPDLPRPYVGLDLLPEHLMFCRNKYATQPHIEFRHASELSSLPDKSFNTIFTCTVLQHIVEKELRQEILAQFNRLLTTDGIFLSVEWADGQRQYDWCTAVRRKEYGKWFKPKYQGDVVHQGRHHSIWTCYKIKSLWKSG